MISIIVIAVVAMTIVYVSWRAGRLDRLHARLDTARASLDAALVRRSSVALELASSGLLDPATSVLLAQAAHEARSARSARELPESDLTRAMRAAFSQPDFRALLASREGADELLTELESAAHQVFLARKFYNDAVAVTQAARRRWLARLLRLAGNAEPPDFFEIDDSLVGPGGEAQAADMPSLTAEPALAATPLVAADLPDAAHSRSAAHPPDAAHSRNAAHSRYAAHPPDAAHSRNAADPLLAAERPRITGPRPPVDPR